MYKLLKDSLKIRRYLLVTILVIQFISVILSTLLPYMNGMFVDMLIDIKNVEEVIKYAITIAGVGIISLFLSYIYNLKIMKVTIEEILVEFSLRGAVVVFSEHGEESLMKLPMHSYDLSGRCVGW